MTHFKQISTTNPSLDTQFVEYAGIHIDDAKQLCIRENLDFNEEFWEPFLKYLNL